MVIGRNQSESEELYADDWRDQFASHFAACSNRFPPVAQRRLDRAAELAFQMGRMALPTSGATSVPE
jgi:hypothetical protein